MQDTNQAITVLQGRVAFLTASISAQQQELDADNLSISQLQGTLQTQLNTLTDDQIAALPQVQDIQAKLDSLTPADTTVDPATPNDLANPSIVNP